MQIYYNYHAFSTSDETRKHNYILISYVKHTEQLKLDLSTFNYHSNLVARKTHTIAKTMLSSYQDFIFVRKSYFKGRVLSYVGEWQKVYEVTMKASGIERQNRMCQWSYTFLKYGNIKYDCKNELWMFISLSSFNATPPD